MNSLLPSYLRLFIFFPLVILLIFALSRYVMRRFMPSSQRGSRIYIVERMAVSPKTLLLVVKVGDEYILLSSGATGVTFLKDLGRNWEEPPAPGEEGHDNIVKFEDLFSSLRNKLSGKKGN